MIQKNIVPLSHMIGYGFQNKNKVDSKSKKNKYNKEEIPKIDKRSLFWVPILMSIPISALSLYGGYYLYQEFERANRVPPPDYVPLISIPVLPPYSPAPLYSPPPNFVEDK